jgi:hypothetical protein
MNNDTEKNNELSFLQKEEFNLHPLILNYIYLKARQTFGRIGTCEMEQYVVLRELGKSIKNFDKFDETNWLDDFILWGKRCMHPSFREYQGGLKFICVDRNNVKGLIEEYPCSKKEIMVADHLNDTINVLSSQIFQTYIFLLKHEAINHEINIDLPQDYKITEDITESILRKLYPTFYEVFVNDWKNTKKVINAYKEISHLPLTLYDISPLWAFGYELDSIDMMELIVAIEEIYEIELPDNELQNVYTMNDLACAIKQKI